MTAPVRLTVKDAAARLGISAALVYRLVAAGEIACIRHSRNAIRFTEDALDAYEARKTQPATTAAPPSTVRLDTPAPRPRIDLSHLPEARRYA